MVYGVRPPQPGGLFGFQPRTVQANPLPQFHPSMFMGGQGAMAPPPVSGLGAPSGAPQAPGPFQRMQQAFANNPNTMLALSTGLLAHRRNANVDPFSGVMAGAYADRGLASERKAEEKEAAQSSATVNWLMKYRGMSEEEAKATVDAGMVSEALRPTGTELTDDMREWTQVNKDRAAEGLPPLGLMDFMVKMREAGRQQINIDTGAKLPPSYRWIDPEKQELGVEPIPGGPATQMPSELAARIGLAKDALTKLDEVEQAAASGEMTGPLDWAKGKAGFGDQGRLGRELAAGAEALTRMLTGAGMNLAEAQREASLYLPQIQDSPETLASKVAQLKRRLEATVDQAMRGRGADAPTPAATATPADAPMRRYNPATGQIE